MGQYNSSERRIYPYRPMSPEREREVWLSNYPTQTEQAWIDTLDAARDEIARLRALLPSG